MVQDEEELQKAEGFLLELLKDSPEFKDEKDFDSGCKRVRRALKYTVTKPMIMKMYAKLVGCRRRRSDRCCRCTANCARAHVRIVTWVVMVVVGSEVLQLLDPALDAIDILFDLALLVYELIDPVAYTSLLSLA